MAQIRVWLGLVGTLVVALLLRLPPLVASSPGQTTSEYCGAPNGLRAPIDDDATNCLRPGVACVSGHLDDDASLNLSCSLDEFWTISKALVDPIHVVAPESGAVNFSHCSAPAGSAWAGPPVTLNFTYTVEELDDKQRYGLNGQVLLTLTNGGNCDARLISLLVLLEQAGVSNVTQVSPGLSGATYQLWGAVDARAASLEACGLSSVLCENSESCLYGTNGTTVTSGWLQQSPTTTTTLDVGSLVVPQNGHLNVALDFEFWLSPETFTALLATNGGAGLNLRVVATFDACCPTGGACTLDYDCDGHPDRVRSVDARSAHAFTWPESCEEACGCVTLRDVLSYEQDALFNFTGSVSGTLSTDSDELVCGDATFWLALNEGCCSVNGSVRTITNGASLWSGASDGCVDSRGESLILRANASVEIEASCPNVPPPPPPPPPPSPTMATPSPSPLPPPSPPAHGPLCSFTQGGYGTCAGGNPNRLQCLRINTLALYQAPGLAMGLPASSGNLVLVNVTKFSAHFASPQGVLGFLPATTTAGTLMHSYTLPPATSTLSGVFGGQLLTLTLNLYFWPLEAPHVRDILFNAAAPGCMTNNTVSATFGTDAVPIGVVARIAHLVIGGGITLSNCDLVFPLADPQQVPYNGICRKFVNNKKAPVILSEVADLYNNAFVDCAVHAQAACFVLVV